MSNELENMIDYINTDNFVKAEEMMNSVMREKITSALDQKKMAIASSMFAATNENIDEVQE